MYRVLSKSYPNVRCELDFKNPFQLLVATVLSAQCTDKRVNQTTPALFKKYKSIKKMAKDIRDKYIDPPNTTDFGIMFLPFEGIYAEVVKKASLLEELQRDYKVIVTGPTTLAAILNSLQMGFRTLTIQKRSSEVWKVLGAVKKEFETFGGLIGKAQNNIQTGLNQLDEVLGVRTRAINSKLKNIEALDVNETQNLLEVDPINEE
jgi:DNA recombination protein RmuC